jgi:hypothetical protein
MIDLAAVTRPLSPASEGIFLMPSFGLPSARAEASRRNGAKSRGPKTPEGKARSAQNGLKHGFRAQKHIVLPGESAAEFQAFEEALLEELAPEGALQCAFARRIVSAVWRLERAERLEVDLFAENQLAGWSLGHALIRDGNGARSFDTLLRYRGGTLAELWRALRTLKALQAERAAQIRDAAPAPAQSAAVAPAPASTVRAPAPALPAQPDEPESPENPGAPGRVADRADPHPSPAPAWLPSLLPVSEQPAPCATPIEPERCRNPAESAPRPAGESAKNGSASLLAGTAPVPARQQA